MKKNIRVDALVLKEIKNRAITRDGNGPVNIITEGIGIDIVELDRIKNIRFLERFAEYFLRPREIKAFRKNADPISFIASRFATKEAVIKAFPYFLKPHDFEIIKRGKKPFIHFASRDNEVRYGALISISHSTKYAAGYAVVVRK
jgi:holo-[acyl-carrier-protein] synthase